MTESRRKSWLALACFSFFFLFPQKLLIWNVLFYRIQFVTYSKGNYLINQWKQKQHIKLIKNYGSDLLTTGALWTNKTQLFLKAFQKGPLNVIKDLAWLPLYCVWYSADCTKDILCIINSSYTSNCYCMWNGSWKASQLQWVLRMLKASEGNRKEKVNLV